MKTFVPVKRISSVIFLSICTISFSVITHAQADYKFINPVLTSGTDKQVNAEYRFSAIKTGVDALVTIKAIVNVTIDSLDRKAVGHNDAFQPSLNISANQVGYVEFEFKFVTTGTSSVLSQQEVNVTSIDVDGSGPPIDNTYIIYEADQYKFSGASLVDYSLMGTNLSVTTSGGWTSGKNIAGVECLDIDTLAKNSMFTMTSNNVTSFLVRMGADNQDPQTEYRLRSLYFKKFDYSNLSPLPLKLLNFTAALNKNEVNLEWTTASEMNVSHFEVEKSTDGKNFNEAGKVLAHGNTTVKMNYSFTDISDNTQSDIVYYRLRSVDIDGKAEYSETRIIRLNKLPRNNITVLTYPNPVSNELRITIPDNWQNKQVQYEVLSINGYSAKKSANPSSSQTETMNVSNLAPGIYIVKATCNGETAQQKIIKH
jgi:hypothetical protein